MNEVNQAKDRQVPSVRGNAMPRIVCAVAFRLAFSTAIIVVVLHVLHCFEPSLLPWTLKSAVPLILIGAAFASLQFALPRTRAQMALGLIGAAAFVLWGTEQFLSNQALVSFIDDIVVFLFVLDLSIVIHGNLKLSENPAGKVFPADERGV